MTNHIEFSFHIVIVFINNTDDITLPDSWMKKITALMLWYSSRERGNWLNQDIRRLFIDQQSKESNQKEGC
jgi:hypothetical protein